jgi:hypothetical protein
MALLLSAGTALWPRAWMLVAILFIVRTTSAAFAYSVNPVLMRERAGFPTHRDQRVSDRILVLAVLATGFLGVPAVAGFDRFHWHLLPEPPTGVTAAGLVCCSRSDGD